ncbi:glutathionylspermidine synthase family protein [Amaricoccus macauensis]|uniref:glutathionylspermidine synthase family protein n=1 Tax=Amaricoccus macauensis TaxID=57001 RepID=UPI003C7BA3D9
MQRVPLDERPDWKDTARDLGFHFHTMHGEPYWDETSAYRFTMEQVETGIEDPSARLHGMCLEAVAEIVASQELMERLCIPAEHRDFIARSWLGSEPALYGRLDLAYDGNGPAKLLEYNADTPTSLYEAASFQWTWLEDQIAAGALPEGTDQFNVVHEAMVARFAEILPEGSDLHFTSAQGVEEDFATVEYMAWTAKEAGLIAHYVALEQIGLADTGQFADGEDRIIGTLFKLYPWEDLLRDPFSEYLAGSACRFLEPPWKALVSNKGILPVLWRLFEGDPNLLPAFFEDEIAAGGPRVDRARSELKRASVTKPIFSREGASIRIQEAGRETEASTNREYDTYPKIVQAYAPLPVFDGQHPVIGAWIVGEACVGMGIREDRSRITQDLSRFKPHFITG